MLILTFTPPNGTVPINGSLRHRYLVEGTLDVEGLLKGFKEMMAEHGVRLLRSKKTDRPSKLGANTCS